MASRKIENGLRKVPIVEELISEMRIYKENR